MNEILGTLKVVAKTGGIKTEETGDIWLNPIPEIKGKIIERIDELKKYTGQKVNIELEGENQYKAIVPHEDSQPQEEIVNDSPKETLKGSLLKQEHITNIQGSDFVTFAGLLDVAHQKGLESIESEAYLIDFENKRFVFKATVVINGVISESYGDATSENANRMVALHAMRVAETRAIARALRWATNIGMTSAEEMGGNNGSETSD